MKLIKTACAGTMESSDIMVTVEPGENGLEIELDSQVEKQYGRRMREVIGETLRELGVENVRLTAVDKGALDCTIRARVKAAVSRGGECGGGETI